LYAKKYDFNDWLKIIYENKNDYYFIHENYLDYLTINGEIYIDYLMNFYNFEEDCNYLKKILKIKSENFHVNQTKHEYYREYYFSKEIEIVGEIYKKDIEFFNFDYENNSKLKEIKNQEKINMILNKKLYL